MDLLSRLRAGRPQDGCGRMLGHGESCSYGHLCGYCTQRIECADEIEQLEKIVARQDELLQRAEHMLNPGREHRMYMDKDCEVCTWLGQVGDLTLIPPRLADSASEQQK